MNPQMSPQVFLALATIAWADGVMAPEERDGILRAARNAGYDDRDLAAIAKRIETPVELASLALHRLSGPDRVFVYAAAEWVALADGRLDPKEVEALKALGDYFKLSEDVRDRARQAVKQVAQLPTGNRPDRYDFGKLRELLGQR